MVEKECQRSLSLWGMNIVITMGNNCANHSKTRNRKGTSDLIPEDTDQLAGKPLPELSFELALCNMELKHPPPGMVGLRLDITDLLEWNYHKQESPTSQTIHWSPEKRTIIKATEYDLRKMFLNVRVLDSHDVELGCLSLNLFYIAAGPWRHDFLIRYYHGSSGRFRADIKCAQTIDVEMRSSLVRLNLEEEHPGEMFHFTLKQQDKAGNEEETSESYDVETFLYNKRDTYGVKPEGESATYHRRKTMILEQQKGLEWSNSISQRAYNRDLPGLSIQLKADSISNHCFHFLLWKKSEEDDDTFELFGESNIPLSKLFWNDVRGGSLNPEVGGTRDIELQEKVEFMGRRCGLMTFRCKVTTPRFFQQVLILTRTEQGISQVQSHLDCQRTTQCNSIRKLRQLKQLIISELVIGGGTKNDLTEKGLLEHHAHKRNIYENIQLLEKLLKQGNGSAPTFEYHSQEDMLRAQNELIDVFNRLLALTQVREVYITETTWRCLKALLLRGEFLLSNMGFSAQEVETMANTPRNKLKKSLEEKITTCESFQAMLLRALSISLLQLGRKFQEDQLKFALAACSVAYFKVPEFRDDLLRAIFNIDDQPRKYCFRNSYNIEAFLKIVDWEGKFSKPLEIYATNKVCIDELTKLEHWKTVLAKRSTHFFRLIEEWTGNILPILGSPDTTKYWADIPGYDVMVGAFIRQMGERKVTEYPDVMKDANMALLANECLLPIFTKILVQKTNTYSVRSTLSCLELLGAYFAFTQQSTQSLPSCFDNKLLYIAIKGIITIQNCFCVGKILQIIHSYFDIFNHQLKKDICRLLLGWGFFRLMLSWSRGIRKLFICFVLYRVLVWSRDNDVVVITRRWEELLLIMEDEEQLENEISREGFYTTFRKNYFEQMRAKLVAKRRKLWEEVTLVRKSKSENFIAEKTSSYTEALFLEPPLSQTEIQTTEETSQNPRSKVKFLSQGDKKSEQGSFRKSQDLTSKKSSRHRRISFHNDFQFPTITPKSSCYLSMSLQELRQTEVEYKAWRRDTKSPNDVPRLEIKMPMDGGDIRPDRTTE